MLHLIKEYSWIVGLTGGVLGVISFYFSCRIYIKNNITEPNKIIFKENFSQSLTNCFNDKSLIETNGVNFLSVVALVNDIIKFKIENKNSFKGIIVKYHFRSLLKSAKKLNSGFDIKNYPFFIANGINGVNDPGVTKEYKKYESEIKILKMQFESLYRSIYDFIN